MLSKHFKRSLLVLQPFRLSSLGLIKQFPLGQQSSM